VIGLLPCKIVSNNCSLDGWRLAPRRAAAVVLAFGLLVGFFLGVPFFFGMAKLLE
jgi:hypothetical protein